jgi:DNA-binding CsgD family transcriptional regulator
MKKPADALFSAWWNGSCRRKTMEKSSRLVTAASLALIGLGALSLASNFIFGWAINVSLPLVVLLLGAVFFFLAGARAQEWAWADLLYLPATLLAALGMIFLIDVITGDWNSWAYAWLLVVAGLGLGVLLANRSRGWPALVNQISTGVVIGALALFILFGAITGGRFVLVMAPILLVLGGLALRWLPCEAIFPGYILRRFGNWGAAQTSLTAPPDQSLLIEPLSPRELEVLGLIDQGLSNAEIAGELIVAPSTVKTHINNIFGKLGVRTRLQALKRAEELGLLVS